MLADRVWWDIGWYSVVGYCLEGCGGILAGRVLWDIG